MQVNGINILSVQKDRLHKSALCIKVSIHFKLADVFFFLTRGLPTNRSLNMFIFKLPYVWR